MKGGEEFGPPMIGRAYMPWLWLDWSMVRTPSNPPSLIAEILRVARSEVQENRRKQRQQGGQACPTPAGRESTN